MSLIVYVMSKCLSLPNSFTHY